MVVIFPQDVYESFNVFMRRKPKENNFKVSVHLGSRAYSLSGQPSLPPHLQAVLETIRDLMNAECVVPDWLHDVFLGYGDPAAAHYNRCELSFSPAQQVANTLPPSHLHSSRLFSPLRTLDFNDTFLSLDHLQASFPQYQVKVRLLPEHSYTAWLLMYECVPTHLLQCTTDDPSKQVPPFRLATLIT